MSSLSQLPQVQATCYLTPLREGGSLPAVVEADNQGTYVLKFRGAGQGIKVLVAEVIVGEIARLLGLPMPELVLMELDPVLGRAEPDPEIQELIKASAGLNLGMDYLPGSITFDPLAAEVLQADPLLAAKIVWLDALVTNIDRTPRNPNLLIWHRKLWLIDHGAALYFQHSWQDYLARSQQPFAAIKDHVLLPFVSAETIQEVDAVFAPLLDTQALKAILELVPESWLVDERFSGPELQRQAYLDYLQRRLQGPRAYVQGILQALPVS